MTTTKYSVDSKTIGILQRFLSFLAHILENFLEKRYKKVFETSSPEKKISRSEGHQILENIETSRERKGEVELDRSQRSRLR